MTKRSHHEDCSQLVQCLGLEAEASAGPRPRKLPQADRNSQQRLRVYADFLEARRLGDGLQPVSDLGQGVGVPVCGRSWHSKVMLKPSGLAW